LKYLAIPVNDDVFEKFDAVQKRHRFKNQSETLEFMIKNFAEPKGAGQ
jgi:hypothetical protein